MNLPALCLFLSGSLGLLSGSLVLPVQAAPAVVTSIKPLQLIAQDIMRGVGQPRLLTPRNADPHHLDLRVSERRLLADADIVLWTGPGLELPLADLRSQIRARFVTAMEQPGLILIDEDVHVWLRPHNGLVIGEALAEVLKQVDPDNAASYSLNLEAFREAVLQTDAILQEQLQPAGRSYAVYHNAFAYFESAYALAHVLSLVGNEALKPGAQQLGRLRELAAAGELACLLAEPDVDQEDLRAVTGTTGLPLIVVDPLGYAIDDEAQGYAALLAATGAAFIDCLGGHTR